MNTTFIFTYPWWFLLFCLSVGALFSYLLYGKRKFIFTENEPKGWKYGLAALRFFSTSLIVFLLLSVLIKTKHTEEEKPVILFLQDNSASLNTSFGKTSKAQYAKDIDALQAKLKDKYEVIAYNFGAQIKPYQNPNYTEQETDISTAFDELYMQNGSRNIGAVILATDGIYNKGNSPLYNKNILAAPIYTIALGDTLVKKDAFIKSVKYPDIVYLGDQFSLNIQIEANHLQGQNTTLEVTAPDGKVLLNKVITINSDHFNLQTEVIGDANKPGVLPFHIRLKTITGETITENNYDIAYVEVLDGRQKIILLYDAPHPDIKALKNAIEQNKNYQIEVSDIKSATLNYKDADLIILDGLPSNGAASKISLLQEIVNAATPILFIVSSNVNIAQLNMLQKIVQFPTTAANGNDVVPIYSAAFSKFSLTENTLKTISGLPPLLSPFGKYQTAATADILFKQQIGTIPTDQPLILFNEVNGKKSGFICGEGIWRWRINEYAQTKKTEATDEVINKSIQYLTVKGDKRRFRVHTPKTIFNANEPISIDAELYNESYELVNDVDANCIIKEQSGKEYKYTFDKTTNAYTLNAGILPVGNYTIQAKAEYKGKINAAVSNFTVRKVLLETLQLQANHHLLQQLSNQSGGKLYYPQNVQQLIADIEKNNSIKTVLYQTFSTQPLIDKKWLFFIILLLLSTEWFIRKYKGNI